MSLIVQPTKPHLVAVHQDLTEFENQLPIDGSDLVVVHLDLENSVTPSEHVVVLSNFQEIGLVTSDCQHSINNATICFVHDPQTNLWHGTSTFLPCNGMKTVDIIHDVTIHFSLAKPSLHGQVACEVYFGDELINSSLPVASTDKGECIFPLFPVFSSPYQELKIRILFSNFTEEEATFNIVSCKSTMKATTIQPDIRSKLLSKNIVWKVGDIYFLSRNGNTSQLKMIDPLLALSDTDREDLRSCGIQIDYELAPTKKIFIIY